MVEVTSLAVLEREDVGTGAARALRRDGHVPAIIYGDSKNTTMVAVEQKALTMELTKPGFFTRLFDLKVGGETQRVLPRELQRHPVTDVPLHVDFLRISATTKVTVEVPVIFENEEESPGIKRGGVLNVVRHSLEVLCRADAIPSSFIIDLSGYEIGDSIHASVVPLPDGVEFTISDRDFTIATVAAPTVMTAEEETEGEEGEDGEEGADAADEEKAESGEDS